MESTIEDLVHRLETRRINRRELVASLTTLLTGAGAVSLRSVRHHGAENF